MAADHYTFEAAPTITSISPKTGSTGGGQTVTIFGTNFTGATEFRFAGTVAATFTVVSATKITVVTPAHAAGVVNIFVTTRLGLVRGAC